MKWGSDLLDLAERFRRADGLDAAWPSLMGAISRWGGTSAGYAFSWSEKGGPQEILMHFDYPQVFTDRYEEAGHVEHDWTVQHCIREPERVALTTERAQANLTPRQMQLEYECIDFGLEHFAMIPLRDRGNGWGGLAVTFGGMTEREFIKVGPACSENLRRIGLLFHGAMRSQPGLGRLLELSPREREVLTWTAAGYSSKLIAHRLNLSARTVEHQIASAQKRLGAQNRTHAVAKALVLNLIEP